jgi:hypothetical protein
VSIGKPAGKGAWVRLVSAVLVLMLSVVALATGIALRTVLAGPDTISRQVSVEHTAPALVIDGSVLSAFPGRQIITVYPDRDMEEGTLTLVYGRTVDVLGWLRPARYTALTYNPTTTELDAFPVLGSESTVPNPLGSDLWFEQYRDDQPIRVSLTAGEGISVAIFSTGSTRAPGTVAISWPIDNATPLSGLLIVLGSVLFVTGSILLALALTGIRRRRGPKKPKLVTSPKPRPGSKKLVKPRRTSAKPRGRRAAQRTAIVLIPVLGLGGLASCATDVDETTEAEVDLTTQATGPQPYPVVTEAQFERLMSRVARQIAAADESLDPSLLEPRMGEPAITMRQAAYRLRSADAELGTIVPIPEGPVRLLVPQQNRDWPRVVFAVIQDAATADAPSLGVVLRQETPRTNYRLHYVVSLAPDTVLPSFPAPAVGSARLARTSQLLLASPADTVAGYADVLTEGSTSRFWRQFDTLTDILFTVVGPEGQDLREESFGSELSLTLEIDEPEHFSVALATTDNGGIVFGVLQEAETVRPLQGGATINATNSARVFSGLPESIQGFRATYEMHVLWYVPPIGSDDRIRVLGYTYQLVDAAEAQPLVEDEGAD